MESPNDGLSEAHLEHRKRITFEVLEEMKAAFRARNRATRFCIDMFTASLAVIAIIITVYISAFTDSDLGLWDFLWGPSEVQQINLSSLMASSETPREAVYVLAIDVSGSLLNDKILDSSVTLFSERFTADGMKIPPTCTLEAQSLTRWHLARAQLCCYLHHFEDRARVGLWKFGKDATLLSKFKSQRFDRSDENLEVEARRELLDVLMSPSTIPKPGTPEFDETNFEALLNRLYAGYIEDPAYKGMDLHFVIISDFVHDSGAKDHPSFVLSKKKIERRFRNIGDVGNAMFHLVATGADNSEVSSVIRMVKETALWYQYRVDSFERSSSEPMADFLYKFVPSNEQVVFYNAAFTTSFIPVHFVWDKSLPQEDDNRLMVGLIADTYGASDPDLAVHLAGGRTTEPCPPPRDIGSGEPKERSKRFQNEVLKSGQRHEFTIRNPGDHLCVKPLSGTKNRPYNYKLALSRSGQGADRKIYVVNVKFQKFLHPLVFAILVICAVVFVMSSAYLMFAMVRRAAGRE